MKPGITIEDKSYVKEERVRERERERERRNNLYIYISVEGGNTTDLLVFSSSIFLQV